MMSLGISCFSRQLEQEGREGGSFSSIIWFLPVVYLSICLEWQERKHRNHPSLHTILYRQYDSKKISCVISRLRASLVISNFALFHRVQEFIKYSLLTQVQIMDSVERLKLQLLGQSSTPRGNNTLFTQHQQQGSAFSCCVSILSQTSAPARGV